MGTSMKRCEICGVNIRTGRKYCFRHRQSIDYDSKRRIKDTKALAFMFVALVVILPFAVAIARHALAGVLLSLVFGSGVAYLIIRQITRHTNALGRGEQYILTFDRAEWIVLVISLFLFFLAVVVATV